MVDYSKWDKFANDISDNEDDDNVPIVSRLEHDQKVQIGPDGPSILEHTSSSSVDPDQRENESKIRMRNQHEEDDLYIQQGETGSFQWRQDKDDVFVFIPIEQQVKASQICVECPKPFKQLHIRINGSTVIQCDLRFDIMMDDANNDLLDWEILENRENQRGVNIILKKKSPLPGTVQWWSCVFQGDDEIDVTTIKARKTNVNATADCTARQGSFEENWKLAQELFKQKIAERKKVDIHADE